MNIIPAILTEEIDQARRQLQALQPLQEVGVVQLDVMDGWFRDNATLTPVDVATQLDPGRLQIDFDLMTEEPLDYVYECVEYKDDLPIRAIIGHLERMSHQSEFIAEVTKHEWQVGLALDVFTPLDAIDDASWEELNIIQLMGVEDGAQGQILHQSVIHKVEALRQELDRRNLEVEIIVDGGVKIETIEALAEAGTHTAVAGSAVWAQDDRFNEAEAIQALLAAIEN